MDFSRFVRLKNVAMFFASFLIFFSKGVEADVRDTIHMPEFFNEIYPFLATIRPIGAGEKIIGF